MLNILCIFATRNYGSVTAIILGISDLALSNTNVLF